MNSVSFFAGLVFGCAAGFTLACFLCIAAINFFREHPDYEDYEDNNE